MPGLEKLFSFDFGLLEWLCDEFDLPFREIKIMTLVKIVFVFVFVLKKSI